MEKKHTGKRTNTNRPSDKKQFSSKKPKFFKKDSDKKPHFSHKNKNSADNNKKPQTPADARKLQKSKKEFRKRLDPNFDLVVQAKTYWERIRDKEHVSNEERKKLITELLSMIEGQMMHLIRKHDGSRVIQSCIKFGNPQQRELIFKELEGNFYDLATTQYSRFLVMRYITIATKSQKEVIAKEFQGKVVSMVKHKDACDVVEKLYQHLSGLERCRLFEELYGKEFTLFQAEATRNLSDIIAENPEKKDSILANLSKIIENLIEKGLVYLSIVHRAINEYMDNADQQKVQELSGNLAPMVIHTVRTQYGAMIAAKCLGYCTAKQRKTIIKSLKGEVSNICCERYGHMLIVKVLDSVDDTILVSKSIIKEMIADISDLMFDVYGRLPFLHLLAPGSTRYFNPQSMKLLAPTEILDSHGKLVPSSKKEASVRNQELLQTCSEEILNFLATNTREIIFDKNAHAPLLEALKRLSGDTRKTVMENILEMVKDPIENNPHVLTDKIASPCVMKVLISENITFDSEKTFAQAVVEVLGNSLVTLATTDFASGIVMGLLKNPSTAAQTKKILKKNISKLQESKVRRIEQIIELVNK